jgi:hypothetical protein
MPTKAPKAKAPERNPRQGTRGAERAKAAAAKDDTGRQEAQRAAAAPAALGGAGRGGRLRPPAARRGGEQGLGVHQEHGLQNPEDRREILADGKLEPIFGAKKATMFEMNKHLARHLK